MREEFSNDPATIGANIRRLREERGMSQTRFAKAVSAHYGKRLDQSHLSRIEAGTYESPRHPLLKAFASALNVGIEDITGGGPARQATLYETNATYRRLLDSLETLAVEDRRAILRQTLWLIDRLRPAASGDSHANDTPITSAALPANVTPFPERTLPRWTEEFPVHPEDFKSSDTDYPLELHAVPVENIDEIAAGVTGAIAASGDPDMATSGWLLHDRAVRDTTHRVVVVKGDSMTPDYQPGWKLLIDLKKRLPSDGDPVYVYIIYDAEAEGAVLGFWEPKSRKGGPRLIKANETKGSDGELLYPPIDLSKFARWDVIGTVQKVVDAPAPKRRKPARRVGGG
jgi:transcriptional regulator with XRE-family HTH domain